jgi:mannose/fructose/N-acetylgalactosamine-specific phosphotransferase system component IIB
MPIVLIRVDERLVHGQVTVGWGHRLHPDRYVVVDDVLPGSEWESDLYRLGAPSGTEVEFVTVPAARSSLDRWSESPSRTVLLLRDLDHLLRLAEDGRLTGASVNLGGLHHRTGRSEVLPYLFVEPEDLDRIRRLVREGVAVSAQDLPGSPIVSVERLLDG